MKNKVLLIITLCLLLIPIHTYAAVGKGAGDEYVSTNLEKTLAEEGIEPVFSSYKENDKQATIYLFRGKGCSYCHSFLTYINSIVDEYGDYFKIVSYEVWYDTKNSELMKEVSSFLGSPATGVPYIIIGDQVFPGYAEHYNEGIKKAIMDLYESKDKYDVFEEMKKDKTKNSNSSASSIVVVILNSLSVVLGTSIVLIFINNKTKKLNKRLDEIEAKLNKKPTVEEKTKLTTKEKKEKE